MEDPRTNDRNTLLFVVLSVAVWVGWLYLFPPPEPELEVEGPEGVEPADPIARSEAPDGLSDAADPERPEVDLGPRGRRAPLGLRPHGTGELRVGRSRSATSSSSTKRVPSRSPRSGATSPARASTPELDGYYAYGGDPGPHEVLTAEGQGLLAGAGDSDLAALPQVEILEQSDTRLVSRATLGPGRPTVTRELRIVPGEGEVPCTLEVQVRWETPAGQRYDGELWVGLWDVLPGGQPSDDDDGGGGIFGGLLTLFSGDRFAQPMHPRVHMDGSLYSELDLAALRDEPVVLTEGPIDWFGLADSYFAALVVPREGVDGHAEIGGVQGADGVWAHGVRYVLDGGVPDTGSREATFTVYAGPKQSHALEAVDPTLGGAVELGFFSLLSGPMMWMLRQIAWALEAAAVPGAWGFAILLLTLGLKVLLFPITNSAFKSGQAMKEIQPKLKELQETLKDDPQELGRRQIALFQEHGVNPVGGCLPMLLQMPIFFALYAALFGSVELYHAEFFYIRDLSAPDPYMILPGLAFAVTLVQMRFMQANMPPQSDPATARMMQLMPILFGILFFTFPAGLTIYILVNMSLTVLQQWYIRRTYEGPKAPTPSA